MLNKFSFHLIVILSVLVIAGHSGSIAKVVDHSKGVYMHDHPDFPSVTGGPGGPYRTHYLHSRFGIGHRRRRAVKHEESNLQKLRPEKREDGF